MTRIAVSISGTGSNLRALQAAAIRGELGGEIVLVVAVASLFVLLVAAPAATAAALVAAITAVHAAALVPRLGELPHVSLLTYA